MRTVLFLFLPCVLLATACGGSSRPGASTTEDARTVRVIAVADGDTFAVRLDGRRERVRIIGIDTPELRTKPRGCHAVEATRALARLVEARKVTLRAQREPRDRYGRLLADVSVRRADHDVDVASELVRSGMARTLEVPPNTRNAARLRRLEREARDARRGLWGACSYADAFARAR